MKHETEDSAQWAVTEDGKLQLIEREESPEFEEDLTFDG